MKKRSLAKSLKRSLAALMTPVLLAGILVAPILHVSSLFADAKTENPFSIKELQGISLDYEKYLNNSVMFPLPAGIKDDQEISVIVTVDTISLMDAYERTDKTMSFSEYIIKSEDAKGIRASIASEKSDVLSNLDESGVTYRLGEEYSNVVSGFELLIKAGDFAKTCSALGEGRGIIVGEVYEAAETQLVENEVDVFDTGIFDSSDAGYDGSGMVVAVLDTGLDSKHTAFSPDNFTSTHLGLTYDDVAALVQQTTAYDLLKGITVDDVYINDKVPFGFDYADNDSDVYSTHNNHGTHVSGVIVGNDDTIRGVAPNAQLVSMKIFSDVQDSSRTAWILAALEDC
ncbi:MAG: S8 family serine peptidase, partial [Clostridia bacterium]|nr:S8 family serine peptidase [Clostridia bacterium]